MYIYLDESVRVKEEKDYLHRIQTHPETYTIGRYHQVKETFGTIVLLSNLDEDACQIYQLYRSRMAIELMFDSMKNAMQDDYTYMQDEEMLQG